MTDAAILLLAAASLARPALAALPPEVQNLKDLSVMHGYVLQHHVVLGALKSIDLETYTIHFGRDCKVFFDRPPRLNKAPGPAELLRFKDATCAVGMPR